jgi:hypothetical protein
MLTGSTSSQLELWTQKYWNVSLHWNGKPPTPKPLSTGDALNTLAGMLYTMNPNRRLTGKIANLLDEVVKGTQPRRARGKGECA